MDKRLYVVRLPDGTELEPADQRVLTQWAEAGRIPPDAEIRSTLVPRWSPARDTAFLKDILAAQKVAEAPPPSLLDRLRAKATAVGPAPKATQEKPGVGAFAFTPGSLALRLGAGLIDGTLILLYGVFVSALAFGPMLLVLGQPAVCFGIAVTLFYVGVLIFLTWSVAFFAQTPGQWYWGLMVVRSNGDQVFMGRAFVFALGTALFWWVALCFIFVLPSLRAPADLLSGTRVIRTRVVRGAS